MPNARWQGPFDAMLPDRTMVRVGDVVNISDEQAKSAHWENLDSPAPRELAAKATPTASTSEGGND